MEFQCELCSGKRTYNPDNSKNNAMPDNWHRWTFIDENNKMYRIFICPNCTNVLRRDYHFSSQIKTSDLKDKGWLDDLRVKIEAYIKSKKSQ